MMAAILAKRMGATVLATTRQPERADVLRAIGVDHVLVDDGHIAEAVRTVAPDGVDGALELVGAPTLYDMEDIARAHEEMEHNRVAAKQVVLTRRVR